MIESKANRQASILWTLFKRKATELLKERYSGLNEVSCTAYSQLIYEFLNRMKHSSKPIYMQVDTMFYGGIVTDSTQLSKDAIDQKARIELAKRKRRDTEQIIDWDGHLVVIWDKQIIDATAKRRQLGYGIELPDVIFNDCPQVVVAACDVSQPLAVHFEKTMIYYEFNTGCEYLNTQDFKGQFPSYISEVVTRIISDIEPRLLD